MVTSSEPPTTAEIARLLIDAGAVRFGDFTLASGQRSDVYVDVKKAWTDPVRLERIAQGLAPHVGDVDRLAGMELGAVPLVVATALLVRRPLIVIRKAAKEHGTRLRYEGEVPPESRVLLIEDVSTTGGSAIASIEVLRAAGARVDRALVVVDREQGAREKLASVGVRLTALATLTQVRGARA